MSQGRVAVLAGGLSFERGVSLRSGSRVADALDGAGWDVDKLDLDEALVARLLEEPPDAVVLALHGRAGEDGTVQGLLEALGIPYTGADPSASALVWDKSLCKGVLSRGGVATPRWATVTSDAIRDLGISRVFSRFSEQIGNSQVVKPAQGGGSMGVRHVTDPAVLNEALLTALSYHSAAIIERHVEGTEVAITILGGEALPAVEVVPRYGSYDFAARYTYGATELFAPARLEDDVLARCRAAALRAWELTGCRDIARADFIIDGDGLPWLLEIDTCPGLTETSLVPMAVQAAGMSFDDFCLRLLGLALARGQARKSTLSH